MFDVQLKNIKHPFVTSGFRGDAIFIYVPDTNVCAAQTLLKALKKQYFIFEDTVRLKQGPVCQNTLRLN